MTAPMAPASIRADLILSRPARARNRHQQGRAVKGGIGHGDDFRQRRQRARGLGVPAGDTHAPHLDFGHHGAVGDARDHEYRQRRRMIGALDKRQPRDDLRRAIGLERDPPRRAARRRRDQRQVALRLRHRLDRGRCAEMRDIGNGEAEMKPRRIPHRGFAERYVGMHRKWRLHIGEGRDDDAPDAFDGVERQDAAVALHQPAHHVGLARRAERRADLLGLLHRDQAIDDIAALHQQAVDLRVDGVDFLAQHLERGRGGGRLRHLQTLLAGKPDGID